jgi:hypothetical protein
MAWWNLGFKSPWLQCLHHVGVFLSDSTKSKLRRLDHNILHAPLNTARYLAFDRVNEQNVVCPCGGGHGLGFGAR